MKSFSRSWRLAKESWAVLMAEPSLLLFPLLSALCVLLAVLVIVAMGLAVGAAVPGAEAYLWDLLAGATDEGSGNFWLFLAVLYVFYFVSTFIATYFTCGLVGAALVRMRGGDPTFGDGLRMANRRIGVIFGYALIAATVGVLLAALRGRGGEGGAASAGRGLLAGLGGMAWGLATFLVVPVIVMGDGGALASVKESASLLKKTFGEQIIGSAGIGLVFLIPMIVVVGAGTWIGLDALDADNLALFAGVLVVSMALLGAIGVLSSALNGVYRAAVYEYATEGKVMAFDADLVEGAFRPKS